MRTGSHSQAMDVEAIRLQLAPNIEMLCQELLPYGRRVGEEWHAGWLHYIVSIDLKDGSSSCPIWDGKVARIRVVLLGPGMGAWVDTETEKTGDPFELVKARFGLNTTDAAEWCQAWLKSKPLPLHPGLRGLVKLLVQQIVDEESGRRRALAAGGTNPAPEGKIP